MFASVKPYPPALTDKRGWREACKPGQHLAGAVARIDQRDNFAVVPARLVP